MAVVSIEHVMQQAREFFHARQLAKAESICRQVLAEAPRQPDALNLLGLIAHATGHLADAERLIRMAIELAENNPDYRNNLGVICESQGKQSEAVEQFQTAMRLRPESAVYANNLGSILSEMGHLEEAHRLISDAIRRRPDLSEAHGNMGNVLMRQGEIAQAIQAYRRAIAAAPQKISSRANLLLTLHYDPTISARQIYEEHLACGKWTASVVGKIPAHTNDRDPHRKLRIGYISADFRAHSVAFFIMPAIDRHDRKNFELFCYSDVAQPDEMTERIKSQVAHWRSIRGVADQQLADRIRADQIDVLVDLSGYTAMNRIGVFARKAAPVQISYLGYPNTTGLEAMDWRITDSCADPPGESDDLNVERLIRLDPCAWCYQPIATAPPIAELPAKRNGYITFGSFNALAKTNAGVLDAWSALLTRLPSARLRIKAGALAQKQVCDRVRADFAGRGIAPGRIDLIGHRPQMEAHLAEYHQIDIALDTFPYNGTTTICEAMWMGVPVVTFSGDRHCARVGASLLSASGLQDHVGKDMQDYCRIAAGLAKDVDRLIKLRSTMRERMLGSALLDGGGFSARLESAYRDGWKKWCSMPT